MSEHTVIVHATFKVLAVGEIRGRLSRINNVVWACAQLVDVPGDEWELRRQVGPNSYGLPPNEHTVWTLGGEPFQFSPSVEDLAPNIQNALNNATRAMLAWVS